MKNAVCGFIGCLLLLSQGLAAVTPSSSGQILVPTTDPSNKQVVFDYRLPTGEGKAKGVLLLIHEFGGTGAPLLKGFWADFADKNGLALIAPTFNITLEDIAAKRCYYYPALWSGVAAETALAEFTKRTGIPTDKLLLWGFSGGAHFVHRFALWHPERVTAFVAISAGWWDDPTAKLKDVPALILCGENDPEHFAPTWKFFLAGRTLNLPWIWRGYKGIGHEVSPLMRNFSAAFLAYYAAGAKEVEPCLGDAQTYQIHPVASGSTMPSELTVRLPTRALADLWQKEQ